MPDIVGTLSFATRDQLAAFRVRWALDPASEPLWDLIKFREEKTGLHLSFADDGTSITADMIEAIVPILEETTSYYDIVIVGHTFDQCHWFVDGNSLDPFVRVSHVRVAVQMRVVVPGPTPYDSDVTKPSTTADRIMSACVWLAACAAGALTIEYLLRGVMWVISK